MSVSLTRIGTTLAAIAVAGLTFAGASTSALGDGFITHHLFEETGADVSADDSGQGQDGEVKRTVAIGSGRFTGGSGGMFGGALYFDTPYGDSTFAAFQSDFDIQSAGSVSFFVEHDFVGYRQAYLNSGGTGLGVEMHSGSTVFSSIPGGDTFNGSGDTMSDSGAWQHVVVSWDESGNHTLTLDGVVQEDEPIGGSGPVTLDKFFRVGQREPGLTRNLDGGIDDLAFYDRVLTPTDVTNIATGGAASVTSGLVTHWNLDDAIGTTTATSNTGSNSIDLLVGGNAKVGPNLVAAAGPVVDGSPLDAIRFNNNESPAAETRMLIADSPTMDFDKTEGTIVMWINKTSTGFGETYLSTDDSTAEVLLRSSNSGRTIFRINGDDVVETDSGVALLNDLNTWHHLAFVWNAVTGQQEIWIDGVMPDQSLVAGSGGPWDASLVSDTGNWNLGFDIASRPFHGYMSDFAIFDFALTGDEINAVINSGAGSLIPTPAALPAGLLLLGTVLGRRRRR